MAHLWYLEDEEWVAEHLAAERALAEWTDDGATIVRIASSAHGQRGYALLDLANRVRINGEGVATGFRVLRDRDELLCGDGRRLWFSAESLAEPIRFRGGSEEEGTRCPRCRGNIEVGTTVVACPVCGVLYHHAEERPCFAFHRECVTCGGPTLEPGEATLGWMPCRL
ncbi:MAG TPA: hypothetical protein VGK20_13040 [Candidatus Binatia bacterium]|jgi:hypothetical protein